MEKALRQPLIGVTGDVEPLESGGASRYRVRVGAAYLEAITRAGGLPVVMHPDPALAPGYVASLNGLLLTGGNDVDTTPWGVPMHPQARPMHTQRQRFELEL